ncbi:unnamed protein product, partial [Protopolystoma xenopodis]
MRKFIDHYSYQTGRTRLFAVDPGDVGFGHGFRNSFTQLLGTADNPGGHIVVSRQFVPNRGWKTIPIDTDLAEMSVATYSIEVNDSVSGSLGLATGTPSDPRFGEVLSLAAV